MAGVRIAKLFSWRRFLIVVFLITGGTVFLLSPQDYLSLETAQTHQAALQVFVQQEWFLTAGLYVGIYIVATAFSFPAGSVLSVLGGFLFGLFWGTALTVAGASIGALLVFGLARGIFGNSLEHRIGPKLRRMQTGFQRNAFVYLLFLRLAPVFPFFLVNLAAAFLRMRWHLYFLATLIGIVPGSFIFVSAGSGLQSLSTQGGDLTSKSILTPEIVVALCGLAVLCLLSTLFRVRRHKRKNVGPCRYPEKSLGDSVGNRHKKP